MDPERLTKLLIEEKVKFIIIGGFAAVAHGVTFLTQDIDICVPFTVLNCRKILSVLKGINPVHRMTPKKMPLIETPESLSQYKNVYLETDLGPVDLIGDVAGIGKYEAVSAYSIEVDLFDMKCRILNIDGLIKSKSALNRPKDMETLLQLKVIKNKINNRR